MLIATGVVLVLALLLGGGTTQGLSSDAAVQIAGAALAPFLVWVLQNSPNRRIPIAIWLIPGVVGLLPLLQLVPLPPALWTNMPGRTLIAEAYRPAGLPLPWLPVSVDPAATWRSFLSLLPPLSLFYATALLDFRARRVLSLVLVAVGLASVFLGLAQVMQGPASPLRLYPNTHLTDGVGFFANRNHSAASLYCLIPIITAWIAALIGTSARRHLLSLTACIVSYAVLLLGLGIAASRAGMTLALVAAFASLVLAAVSTARGKGLVSLSIAAFAAALGIVLVVEYALFGLLDRFATDPLADYRFVIGRTALEAAGAVQPLGAGFGTFVPVYQLFEHPGTLIPNYVNRAHSDWIEGWLEGGYAAIAVMATYLGWFLVQAWRAWHGTLMPTRHIIDQALPRAATIIIVLLMLHSIVDYPLRTTALATMFALSSALLVPPIKRRGHTSLANEDQHAASSAPSGRAPSRARHAPWQTRTWR